VPSGLVGEDLRGFVRRECSLWRKRPEGPRAMAGQRPVGSRLGRATGARGEWSSLPPMVCRWESVLKGTLVCRGSWTAYPQQPLTHLALALPGSGTMKPGNSLYSGHDWFTRGSPALPEYFRPQWYISESPGLAQSSAWPRSLSVQTRDQKRSFSD